MQTFFSGSTFSTSPLHCSQRPSGLAQAGDSTKVWTRANNDVTCSLSDEPTPPLAPNRPLVAGHLFS